MKLLGYKIDGNSLVIFIAGVAAGRWLLPVLQNALATHPTAPGVAHPATHRCTGRCDPHVCDDGSCPDTGCGVLHRCECHDGNCRAVPPVPTTPIILDPTNPFQVV